MSDNAMEEMEKLPSDLDETKAVGLNEPNPFNKKITLGVIAFSVVEAVAAFFLIFRPLFINPIYHNQTMDELGMTYKVKLFGNAFLSEAEKSSGVVYFPLSSAVINIILIYLLITLLPILCSLFFNKGFAFAKTGLTAVFGLKAVVGLMPILVPFSAVRNSMRVFGAVDAAVCIAACGFFVYLSSVEFADDMLYSEEQRKSMLERGKLSGLLVLLMTALVIFEKLAMPGYGSNWSIIMGGEANKQYMQGYILVFILAFSILSAILYIRESNAALYFFAGFGGSIALTNVYAIIKKIVWVNTTYKNQKALAKQGDEKAQEWIGSNGMGATWWKRTIFIAVCMIIAAAVLVFAFMKIRKRVFSKPAPDEKKPALVTWICSGMVILCFILSIIAVTNWDKKIYSVFTLGAMDYMYLIVYGGLTLFIALAMLGGCGFSKWGALALYILVGASNFSTIFRVFSTRSSMVAKYPGYHGYDYIVIAVMLILTLVCCLSIIAMFVYKEISIYMYNKQNS